MKTLVMLLFATIAALTAQQIEPLQAAHSSTTNVVGVAPGPQLILGAQMVGGSPVTGSPYSAEAITDTTQTLLDGNRIEQHSSSMRYRDSLGRERREEALFGAAGTSIVFVSDPVARMNYTLDQKTHTAQKIGPLAPMPPPPPPHGGSLGVLYLPTANQAELLRARGIDHGAFVNQAVKGSPAEKAGIQSGDVILAVDGQPIKDSDDFGPHIWAIPAGNLITLNVDRGGKNMDIKVALQDRTQVFPPIGGGPQTIVSALSQLPSSGQAQTITEDLGSKIIEGVLAEGKRSTMTIPAGEVGNKQPIVVVSESWYSPDLQIMTLIKHSDPRVGDTVYRLTNISRTEPPSSLFRVPPDYTVTQGPGLPGLLPAK